MGSSQGLINALKKRFLVLVEGRLIEPIHCHSGHLGIFGQNSLSLLDIGSVQHHHHVSERKTMLNRHLCGIWFFNE